MDILSCEIDPNQLIIEEESKKNINGDEYPIIWYDPHIDSEEKKTLKALIQENSEIHLFSKFEEAFTLVQSLGSFLLITPTQVDEEKLFQDFKTLQDTHGRRYFDFEEEEVLRSLFKEIPEEKIKSLKVYVFCTRESFLNKAPANEKEEEVMVMCDIQGMAEQFREEYTIFWCDPDFSPEMKETLISKLDIEEKNIYTNIEELLMKIENYHELPYHLILSGKTKIESITNKIDDLKDLLCLYIYDSPPLIVNGKKARKIKMEKSFEGLVPKIIEGVRTNLKYKNTFPAFATQFDDWDKSHINKVHYYLRGFINFKNRRQAKGDFINLAKRIYQSKKLLEFEEEYSEFSKEQMLKWYATQSPIYKLVNNCLRIATSDSIIYCRFVLKDLERAIREEYQQQSKKYNRVVYRGAYISKDEFEKLERNIGKEIEMYGFLSTSMNKKKAENFVYDDIKNKVFITIIIPPIPSPDLDEQGFADLKKFSEFSEEEILFNVRSRFQVLEVGSLQLGENNKDCRHLVLLYGAQLLRQSLTIENPTTHLIFELPQELKCTDCRSKKNLFAYTNETEKTQVFCQGCLTPNNLVSKSTFLLPIDGKTDLSEEKRIGIDVKGRMLEFGTEAKLTYAKTDKCHLCFKFSADFCKWINLEDGNIILDCLECFQRNQEKKINHLLLFEGSSQVFWGIKQARWEEIEMNWKAEEFQESEGHYNAHTFEKTQNHDKFQELCRKILQSSVRKMGREEMKAISYWNLGNSSEKLGEYQKGLEYHLKALDIRKFIFGEAHPRTAISFPGLASAYYNLGEYKKAFEYHLKTLEIRKSIYGEVHPEIAASYNNIATSYEKFGEYQKALDYHLKALEILKLHYGVSDPYIAGSYYNLASVYGNLGEDQKALEYHQKALDIRISLYGEAHRETAASYNNLALIYAQLGEFQRALEYHLKVLKIVKSILGESHRDIAVSYYNLASVYGKMGESQRALEYHLKALDIRKSTYGETHPETASSYDGLASVYHSLREFQKTLEYALKALDIKKSIYGEAHPHIAASLIGIALIYHSLREYQAALKYHLKALEITKYLHGEVHPKTAASYTHLAIVYSNLGEEKKSLEYQLKVLNCMESIHGEFHPKTAGSYNNLAVGYNKMGEYQKALQYHLKALEIRKFAYGEAHPETAISYSNLALVYQRLGEDKKALEYHLKALEISKSIYGESHPMTAMFYNNLAFVYDSLGESQKVLEYLLKTLEMKKIIHGEAHPETAVSYRNLASAYLKVGENEKALEYALKAVEIKQLNSAQRGL